MIINKAHLCSRISVWEPRYHDKVALVSKRKVDFGTPIIIIEFPKSKSYKDGRYAIRKQQAQTYPVKPNGNGFVYEIPVADMEAWESSQEVLKIIEEVFA